MGTSGRDCFALLDDREATRARPTSRLYRGLQREHRCINPVDLDVVWAGVQADQRAGHSDQLRLTQAPLQALDPGEVKLLIAPQRLSDDNPRAQHKTTPGGFYDAGVRAAELAGAFDSLFLNHSGWLVEGARSSVFVRLDGRWWIPPVADGALPGVTRGMLLEDPSWSARERRLGLPDLQHADGIMVCNALRGVLPARLLRQAPQVA